MAEFKRMARPRSGGGGIFLWAALDDNRLPAGAGLPGSPLFLRHTLAFFSLRVSFLEGDSESLKGAGSFFDYPGRNVRFGFGSKAGKEAFFYRLLIHPLDSQRQNLASKE